MAAYSPMEQSGAQGSIRPGRDRAPRACATEEKKEVSREAAQNRRKNEKQTGKKREGGKGARGKRQGQESIIFESVALVVPGLKITELGGGKKVRRSGRDASKVKKQRFDWKFPIGSPEKDDFFPFFGVLDP